MVSKKTQPIGKTIIYLILFYMLMFTLKFIDII